MAKTILGLDIGSDSLKLVLLKGNKIKKSAVVAVPENVVRDGHIISVETMAETIKEAMKENKISASRAGVVLSGDNIFVRNVQMPRMNHEQLMYNLKYEFKDYITNEPKNYIFDYAMVDNSTKKVSDEPDTEPFDEADNNSMELMAVVAPREVVEETARMVKKAGLKLAVAAPPVCAYKTLIERYMRKHRDVDMSNKEFCILDIGHSAIRMYMFKRGNYNVTRALEMGLSNVDMALADSLGVDEHLAHTYLVKNYNECQSSQVCQTAFDNISVELMRVLNFYRFSNPDSNLSEIWICGGGVAIPALRETLQRVLDMDVHMGNELMPDMEFEDNDGYLMLLAAGIVME